MDADAIADSNSFDVSGTSVAILQGFLNATVVVSIDEAIEILRAYCPDCSPEIAEDTLVANKWEVAQITIDWLRKRGLQVRHSHLHGREDRIRSTSGPTRPFSARFVALRRCLLRVALTA